MFSSIDYHRKHALKLATTTAKQPFLDSFDDLFVCAIVSAEIGRKKWRRGKLCGHNQPNPRLQLQQRQNNAVAVLLFSKTIVMWLLSQLSYIIILFYLDFSFRCCFLCDVVVVHLPLISLDCYVSAFHNHQKKKKKEKKKNTQKQSWNFSRTINVISNWWRSQYKRNGMEWK